MKEFQALGLDISIINDDGQTLELKEIEEAEDKEDSNMEFENVPAVELRPDSPDESSDDDDYDDEDDEFDDEDEEFKAEYYDFMDKEFAGDESFEEGADI